MSNARSAGAIRGYVLGIVLDALTLNAVVATVLVFDAAAFDDLFQDLVASNSEGEVVSNMSFDQATISELVSRETLGQTSAACLNLAWQQRSVVLESPAHP